MKESSYEVTPLEGERNRHEEEKRKGCVRIHKEVNPQMYSTFNPMRCASILTLQETRTKA